MVPIDRDGEEKMTGTFINVIAILVGSGIGMLFGPRLSHRLKSTGLSGMGIFTAAVGMKMFPEDGKHADCPARRFGAVLGEWLKIEDWLINLGIWIEKRIPGSSRGPRSFCARFFGGIRAVLHRTDGGARLDQRRSQRRLSDPVDQIRSGWFSLNRIFLPHWGLELRFRFCRGS